MASTNHMKHRLKVYRRDGFRCVYCHKRVKAEALTLDHVIPKSRGGTDKMKNLVTACLECNSKKGAMDPKTWVTYLGATSENREQVGQVDGLVARAISADPSYRRRERQAREDALQESWQQHGCFQDDIDWLDDIPVLP